jgi:hypothetical protein
VHAQLGLSQLDVHMLLDRWGQCEMVSFNIVGYTVSKHYRALSTLQGAAHHCLAVAGT